MRGVLDSAKAEQKNATAVLTATATIEQMKALAASGGESGAPGVATTAPAVAQPETR
jgi:hypothetical protein